VNVSCPVDGHVDPEETAIIATPTRNNAMKCPSCSTELADNAKFCPECGEKIVRKAVCPDCGAEAALGAKFCAECGHRFAAAAPKPAAPAPAPAPAPESVPVDPDSAAVKAALDRVFALFHDKDGNCKNATKADAELVKAAAEGGDARAMFLLGEILSDGCDGFAKDPKASAEWYRKSAEAGDAWGMSAYGMLLANGDPDKGVEKNPEAAQEWIVKGGALLATRGEQTAMNALLLGSAVAQAPEPDGEDGPPDLGAAAAIAGVLLQAAGDVGPETAPAVDRMAVGLAHFVLAMDAMAKQDFDLTREHLEQGAEFGNEDCKKALAEIEGGGEDSGDDDAGGDDAGDEDDAGDDDEGGGDDGVPGEEAGYLVEKDGYLANRGNSTKLSIGDCGYKSTDGCRHFDFTISVSNESGSDTGSLKLCLWFCGKDFEGGKLDGHLMCSTDFPDRSLRRGCRYEQLALSGVERTADPPTGDYRAVVTVNELKENGKWNIVGWTNFQNDQHWNHEGGPTASRSLSPEDAEMLEKWFSDLRKNYSPTAFLVGREITRDIVRTFADAAKKKIGDAGTGIRFRRSGVPIAFVDGTMFGSRKAGLLVTQDGLYAVNGFSAPKSCPSGCIDWADFAGEHSSLETVEKYNVLLCGYPAVGVNLAIGDELRDDIRQLLVDFRHALRGEEIPQEPQS